MQVMTIQILKAFHSRALRQARLVLTQMITIQMPMVLKKQYKAKYIVNLVNEKEYYGDIVIKGVNEYQGITLYDEDGSTVIANSTSGILTRFYTMRKNVVNLPFTVTSHNIDNEFVTEHYILTLTRRMPELEEVRADDNLLIYNKIQYTYQALPNAKKVKVYVKANDKDAKVQIGDFDWALYEDEQDYDISKAGETTFTVPLNISVYPYTEYTTRNLVITKGDSKLKQISVSVKDNDEAVSRRIAANDYGEYVAVIPEENTSEYVTVSLNAPSDGYVLELYRQGTKLATGVADEDTGSFERRIDLYNVENLNNARNELTIYVSDGQGNEALYPLWLNKVSSNTAVKTVIAQRGTSEESVAENNTDTSSNCDSHEVEITDSAQAVKLYIEAEDPTATVKVGTKSRVGSIEISVPVSTGRSSYDVDFDIISTATDENGIAVSQAHKVTLVRQSDVAELESVVVNDTNVVASGTSYNAHNLTSETANVVLKAKNNGRIEVIDRLENVLASDDTTLDSVWTDSDMPLENGETTKYVVRVTSQSGRKSVDYMLVLERADYVGGLEFLKTKLADEDDYTTLQLTARVSTHFKSTKMMKQ